MNQRFAVSRPSHLHRLYRLRIEDRCGRLVCRADPTARDDSATQQASVECVGEGQGVTCTIDDTDIQESLRPEDFDSTAAAGMATDSVRDLWSLALLISPFFFWGTSMVFMKVCY